jgi:hypothetical protein
MSHAVGETEDILRETYEAQAASYAQALELAEGLLANWKPGNDVNETLQKIAGLMEQIAKRNLAIEQPRRQWLEVGKKPGPRLDAALQSMSRLIQRLAERIRELERLATAHKDQLAPQLDHLRRGRQMQRAYATNRIR